jgi:unsaturated chondroitin disaccharide hydrolase
MVKAGLMMSHRLDNDELTPKFLQALEFVAVQAKAALKKYPGNCPMYTVGGLWNQEGERWTHWCEGFFPGILWLLFKHTGEDRWRRFAEQYSLPLEPRRFDRDVHDLGFLFFSTYLRWHSHTQDPHLRKVLIEAGQTLALRRQKGGYLCSFIGPHSLFIDIMMNVGIVFWAARELGDKALYDIALEHCRTSARHLVRPDGSTAHEGIFDVQTGAFLHQATHQGWSAESAWSRGQAWAIYGFTAAYRLSGESEFLLTAQKCAEFWLRQEMVEGIAPWDFRLPSSQLRLWDSSASAIAASAFWDLSEELEAEADKEKYRTAALDILGNLCSDTFLALHKPHWEGILQHGLYHYHKKLGVDESVIWGDHFFVEALVKAVAGRSEAIRKGDRTPQFAP